MQMCPQLNVLASHCLSSWFLHGHLNYLAHWLQNSPIWKSHWCSFENVSESCNLKEEVRPFPVRRTHIFPPFLSFFQKPLINLWPPILSFGRPAPCAFLLTILLAVASPHQWHFPVLFRVSFSWVRGLSAKLSSSSSLSKSSQLSIVGFSQTNWR